MARLVGVVESRLFASRAKRHMNEGEINALVTAVASDPFAGIHLGGGIRKLRVARPDGGKSGGFRVIYYFAEASFPLVLLTLFAKNEKDNLKAGELAALSKLIEDMKAELGARR